MDRRSLRTLRVLPMLLALVVSACAPAPASTPAAPTARPPSATTAPATTAPAAATPAAEAARPNAPTVPAPAAQDAWKIDWDITVAAAKQEGKLVVSGSPGELWRTVLTTFEQDYPGIKVEYSGQWVRDLYPRLVQERGAGMYLLDVRVGGPDPQVFQARDEGMFDPVRPLLVLPEVLDDSKWLGGFDAMWADKEKKYLAGFFANATSGLRVNRDVVPEGQLQSFKELADPRWKGKIATDDPRGGAGLAALTTWLAASDEQFMRELLTNQGIVVNGNLRQLEEWVVRGQYPIGIGAASELQKELQAQGQKVNVEDAGERLGVAIGFGAVAVMNRAPHPNASKVFANWLLTRDVQDRMAKALGWNSRRLDVAPGDPKAVPDAARLGQYFNHQHEDALPVRARAQKMALELLK